MFGNLGNFWAFRGNLCPFTWQFWACWGHVGAKKMFVIAFKFILLHMYVNETPTIVIHLGVSGNSYKCWLFQPKIKTKYYVKKVDFKVAIVKIRLSGLGKLHVF